MTFFFAPNLSRVEAVSIGVGSCLWIQGEWLLGFIVLAVTAGANAVAQHRMGIVA